MSVHPIFATREPLHIAAMQKLLADAGIVGDLSVVYPEELEQAAVDGSDCLMIVDGQSRHLPRRWRGPVAPRLARAS